MQINIPFTGAIKRLVIANFVIWLVGQMIVDRLFFSSPLLVEYFGFTPYSAVAKLYVWQVFTYMFLHSTDYWMHIVFNMLTLWLFGSELQQRWGQRFFFLYYVVSGVGAALIYLLGILVYGFASGNFVPMGTPVIGASGAVFGVMLAYAIFFGERTVYFMMIFPMKARVMVLIIGGIEVVSLLSGGPTGQVANLAHLGGLLSGFLFLRIWAYRQSKKSLGRSPRRGRKLRLVVNNEKKDSKDGPRYWN